MAKIDNRLNVFKDLSNTPMLHRNLCMVAARFLKNKGLQPFHKCQYVVCELERVGECPDAFGWSNNSTQLIEVKTSRADFLKDKKKPWRAKPEIGIGAFRSYLCPADLIKPSQLPEDWGLLYVHPNGSIESVVIAKRQACNHNEEIALISSILRRHAIAPKIFSFKNYKTK